MDNVATFYSGHSHFAQELRVDIASRAITRRKTVLWRSVVVGGNEGDGEEGGCVGRGYISGSNYNECRLCE